MWLKQIPALLVVLGVLLPACSGGGGGGGSSSPPTPSTPPAAKILRWSPPEYFMDNTPLTPARDLESFEIHVRQDLSFGADDNAIATAPPGDNSFNLATLSPPLSRGVTYNASVRAVPVEGEKSDFSSTVSFSLPK